MHASPPRRVRVLIADGDADVRSALRWLLTHQPNCEVVGESETPEALLREAHQPDVIVLDWDLRGLHTGDRLATLRRICPRANIVALSTREEQREPALRAGLSALVCKSEAPDQLLAAMRLA